MEGQRLGVARKQHRVFAPGFALARRARAILWRKWKVNAWGSLASRIGTLARVCGWERRHHRRDTGASKKGPRAIDGGGSRGEAEGVRRGAPQGKGALEGGAQKNQCLDLHKSQQQGPYGQ